MAGPLDWLLPGPDPNAARDPMAWLMAQQNQPLGAVPPDQSGPAFEATTPNAAPSPQAPTQPQAQPQAPGEPSQRVNRMPGGAWQNWMSEAGNREFFLSTMLSLANGASPAASFGAGFNAMSGAQQSAAADAQRAMMPQRRGRGRRRSLDEEGSPPLTTRGTPYVGHPAHRGERGSSLRGRRRAEGDRGFQAVSQFLQQSPTLQDWERENAPGGLVHVAFGGPQPFGTRNELLTQVQAQAQQPSRGGRRELLGPRGYPTYSAEELIGLRDSQNPADRLRFQNELQRIQRRSPGVGNVWNVDDRGNIVAVPMPGAQQRGGGQRGAVGNSQIARNTVAAMGAGLTSLRDAREALQETNWAQRFIQGGVGIGPMADLMPQLNRLARLPMHGVSGAQVNIPETQSYLNSFMPSPMDPRETWSRLNFKLNNLEWLLAGMLQAAGGQGLTDEQALALRNGMRERLGSRALSMEEHLADQAGQPRPPRTQGAPDIQLRAPGQTPGGAGPQQPPAGASQAPQAPPVDVRTPEEANRLPPDTMYRTPDGAIYRR